MLQGTAKTLLGNVEAMWWQDAAMTPWFDALSVCTYHCASLTTPAPTAQV